MNIRPAALVLSVALSAMALRAGAADGAAPPPSDLDALSLADGAPATAPAAPRSWRVYLEAAALARTLGDAGTRADAVRASIDLRVDAIVVPGLRAVLSDRLDLVHDDAARPIENVNTLREAYLSWARTETQVFDMGRVNVRHGAAMGFNPTDWFKEGALRGLVSPDPAALRENRQGTVVLQGQQLWPGGGASLTLSPRLSRSADTSAFALDAGATNPRDRWLLAGSMKLGDGFTPELLLHGGKGTPTQLGLNLSALAGDAVVVFGEFSVGDGRSLIAQSLGTPEDRRSQRRASLGVTYTTPFNLGVTVEAEYNSAAPDRRQWQALSDGDPAAPLQLLGTASALQDLPARQAVFVYLTWKDALMRRVDVSGFVRQERATHSRSQWLEARYRWDHADLALQWLSQSGAAGSVYRTVPLGRSVELALRYYLH